MAFLVFHDAFADGEMDVYPFVSYDLAVEQATLNNLEMDSMGYEGVGHWRAYDEQLPIDCGIFAFHTHRLGDKE